jgi:2-polyprenyl-6-methoxyphenol hydroxylase-like FAD-dependent oxidoreductase
MPSVERVLIVGGGISGMSLAIALSKTGIATDVVEISPNWGTYGAGLSLTGPGLRAFHQLGVLTRIEREGYCSGGTTICDRAGNILFATPVTHGLGSTIQNRGGIMRPALHVILADATLAAGAKVRTGLTVSRLENTAFGVQVSFSDGARAQYDLVVGADGINSRMRSLIFPDAPHPQFTGQSCWRAVAPRPAEIDGARIFLGAPVKVGLNPVSQSEMYMFVLQHVPQNPRMPDQDLHKPLAALLEGFGGAVGRVREELGPHSRVVYRPLENLLLPPPWYKERTILIGDAAHATTPHLASGAAIGVEDALVLAEELAAGKSVDAALARFMTRRFERCRLVVENSALLGELEITAAPVEHHTAMLRQSAAALAQPF